MQALVSFFPLAYMKRMESTLNTSNGLPFRKMHGLGNDFVIVDARGRAPGLTESLVRAIGHRNFGVGFDQLVVLRDCDDADVEAVFYNSDGSTSGACGNASRCIARLLIEQTGRDAITMRTARGLLPAVRTEDGKISVNMGQPQLDWQDVPLAHAMDTLELPIEGAPSATGMGNPHCTFFVADAEAVDLATFGPTIEHHPLYPQRTNVQVAHLVGPDHIRMRVWERGVGVTLASGSSSCATVVTAARRGLTGRKVRVDLDGGSLMIDWREDGVWMTGAATYVFDGVLTPEFLAGA